MSLIATPSGIPRTFSGTAPLCYVLVGGHPTPSRRAGNGSGNLAGQACPVAATQSPPDDGRHRTHLFPGRTFRLTLRFSEREIASLREAAAAAGITPTGFCAEAAVAAALHVPPSDNGRRDRVALARLQRELFDAIVAVDRVGRNLNQAVAQLNASGVVPSWLERAVAACRRSVERLDDIGVEIDRALR